ncbi:MAG: tRNA 2-thiocytidine(32) synthetase TtcA [Spirochaetia bacterium]|nr:tRNA 2-thiocytidine(32) synthetase TtcA [Spirochaetia bacterium]
MQQELFQKINRLTGRAIGDYNLIREKDRILVAVSGGKDSLLLLKLFREFKKKSPVPFEFTAVHLDQGNGSKTYRTLETLFQEWNVHYKIVHENTHSIVKSKIPEGQIMCPMCSRLRRGILYRTARELKCNKIALGHHSDDLLETFMMNAFFSGKLGSMTPIYQIDEGDLYVIRPLIYLQESMISEYVTEAGWPVEACSQCGSSDILRRSQMKDLIADLEKKFPGMKHSLMGALKNPHANELLNRDLWKHPDFAVPN